MSGKLKAYIIEKQKAFEKGIHFLSKQDRSAESIRCYLEVRDKEGRLYSDEALAHLPWVEPGHPLRGEWGIRAESLGRLSRYLRRLGKGLTLLDVGCGNGWMSHGLAHIPGCEVFALDLNRPELEQGARVFNQDESLTFLYGDLFEDILPPASFQIVTLAGSVQYFPDLNALLTRLLWFLEPGGEIHIVDSPFYTPKTIEGARQRTREHFAELGHPQMAGHYHHPLAHHLEPFHPRYLHDPRKLRKRLYRKFMNPRISPFPWIRVRKMG